MHLYVHDMLKALDQTTCEQRAAEQMSLTHARGILAGQKNRSFTNLKGGTLHEANGITEKSDCLPCHG